MEELRKLEKVQSMLEFMESHSRGVSNSDQHSNRFLANFILFLIEPCGDLSINHKCSLLSHFIPTLSSAFLEDAYQHHLFTTSKQQNSGGFQQSLVGNSLLSCNQMKEYSLLQRCNENAAMVGLDSMQMANSTLEDFLDKMNEKLLQTPCNGNCVFGEKDERETKVLVSCFSNEPVRPLVSILEHKGLLTEREELRLGEEYWALERKLCSALTNKEEILVEDVMKAIHLKSFDYRVLNLLLYQLQGTKVEELHMEFLSISEFLVEVSDDLYDYEDDVLENNFNILRMFIRIYGPSAAPAMLAKCIGEAEDKYASLLKSLDPHLSLSYQKRCAEATKEGGKVSEHPLGTWSIPTVIQDEELYRLKLKVCQARAIVQRMCATHESPKLPFKKNSTTPILLITILITFLLHHLLCPVSCFNQPQHAIPPPDPLCEEKNRLGSMPPTCHNKCNRCHPCMAVQVPASPSHERVHPGLAPTAAMEVFFLQGNRVNGIAWVAPDESFSSALIVWIGV
ncbi:hypothetical protein JHK82_049074 [Glycine max]|nr:hypothetical protein JHK86_048934 [Glycine max]KAG5090296.1 hypothetical protein JHK82_049074 [Glycine max]KAG5093376.1 hypothetical protein JHK84_048964 [Glycine max]